MSVRLKIEDAGEVSVRITRGAYVGSWALVKAGISINLPAVAQTFLLRQPAPVLPPINSHRGSANTEPGAIATVWKVQSNHCPLLRRVASKTHRQNCLRVFTQSR